ncbi:hypothetical protein BN1051_01057 [Arthrobacter saudimassiliensis]|uniref:TPR-repeat-containing protein n=1 Tax=Arthrobacter saudimassiliensis TaxID=1461584 RepID=A0A078MN70_9MICC|nr:hypothetical protein BN1051_01057 [Arthrobacter saudimassiliensis]
MAGRLIDIDPELAFQHAVAASSRAGRLASVREAVGLTAYAAEHFGEALREFRTHRRISGSTEYLPIMADCERGLGRPDKALELAASEEAAELSPAGKVDMAIVVSGAHMDLEQYEEAVTALEIPQLDRNRAFSYSPQLFRAYADALELVDRAEEAEGWRRQALVAERALGVGDFAEPEIYDFDEEDEQPRRPRHTGASTDAPGTVGVTDAARAADADGFEDAAIVDETGMTVTDGPAQDSEDDADAESADEAAEGNGQDEQVSGRDA